MDPSAPYKKFPEVPGGYPFPRLEQEVLAHWREHDVFRRTLEQTRGGKPFVFFEGPPTANNAPHVGHVVTRVVKDLFPRYQTMRGRYVARKAGWDTHGLPVEIEVEKRLGFTGKQQIEEYGIAAFNEACRESVHTYEQRWREMSERVGYWLDFDHAYWTYSNEYIESVWWALADLHSRGLLYRGYKIQPYCTRCGTTLSTHEVAQNYKEVDDPSVWTLFSLQGGQTFRTQDNGTWNAGPHLKLVAWTTTPWTTLANVGLAVHPFLIYKVVEYPGRPGEQLLFGDGLDWPVPLIVEEEGKRRQLDLRELPALAWVTGRDLESLTYDRLYTFFAPQVPGRVVLGDYVTVYEGTGIVHTAPPFGEDDYATGKRYGLPMLMTIDAEGKIATGAGPFAGMWFKDADAEITRDLKARGLLLHGDRYRHNYPFCWRCDRPLLYYATDSWFVKTTEVREQLIRRNREITWRPEHVGEGRFGNWLENVVDWSISRSRYWGTPLPIWYCEHCNDHIVLGSFKELFRLAGEQEPANIYSRDQFDPHRPFIDENFSIACRACKGNRIRVPYVLDAWFDSGSMPFAQHHYLGRSLPSFDPRQKPDAEGVRLGFPAYFISEAVDQTRGWFYTLHALGVLLFDSVAYKNCIVLGHVNDEQGRKMSKRLGNVVEPMGVIAETGADALRWYFSVSDPEKPSRFSAHLVREAAQGFLLPLWNALSFFTIYANLDGWNPGTAKRMPLSERAELDRWILLLLDNVVAITTDTLDGYRVALAAGGLENFLENLTNWYIRRSRARFWAGGPASADKEAAYQTLYEVLTTLAHLLAPFTPFLAEALHGHLVRSQQESPVSVHLEAWPVLRGYQEELGSNEAAKLIGGMLRVQQVVALGRAARNTHSLKTRQPLAGVTLVAHSEEAIRPALERFAELVQDELNVKEIRWAERRGDFVRQEVRPNFRLLGKKLGPRMPKLKALLESGDGDALAEQLEEQGAIELEVDGEPVRLEREELEVRLVEKPGMATAGDRELLVALDTELTPELVREGLAREFVHKVQSARKDGGLDYADRIVVRYRAADEEAEAIREHAEWIKGETLALELVETGEGELAIERAG